MKIIQTKSKSKPIKEFSKKVWIDANIEHYGKDILFDDHDITKTKEQE
ncbi:MAG: hypothetical protein KBD46_02790 [Candidatus Levybacteria bacterium]|nr:hypothetical protein [Candidatus Levybacteria bacterium]